MSAGTHFPVSYGLRSGASRGVGRGVGGVGGAHRDVEAVALTVRDAMVQAVEELHRIAPEELIRQRVEKFRGMGAYQEESPAPGR